MSESTSAIAEPEGLTLVEIVNGSRIGPLQLRVFWLCALVALVDGFDSQLLGPAARSIAQSLHLNMSDFGPVFSASQVGFLFGALIFGPIADIMGKRTLLIANTTVFALFTLITPFADSLATLLFCRLLVGLAIGGASPSFIGLVAEYIPERRRAQFVTLLWAAVPLGGMLGSMASSAFIETAGWTVSFYVGGALSLGGLRL